MGGSFALSSPFPKVIEHFQPSLNEFIHKPLRGKYGQKVLDHASRVADIYGRIPGKNFPAKEKVKLTQLVREGLRIINDNGWILKEADKNLGLVVMTSEVYEKEVLKHLDETHRKVANFPIAMLQRVVKTLMNCAPFIPKERKAILDKCLKYDQPALFYVIPKIHKSPITTRPITAQHSYILTPLSQMLSKLMNEHVADIYEIAKNSKSVVQDLEKLRITEDVLLVTYDVKAMYPSIDLEDAFRTLSGHYLFQEQHGFWMRVLQAIMRYNFVEWNGDIYQQMQGTAMGTAVAPAFANMYMHLRYYDLFITFAELLIFNRRYIDDGLLIVSNNKSELSRFQTQMNNLTNLDFTWEISNHSAVFLDLTIYKGERYETTGIMDLEVYTKPISKFLYLHRKSNHPPEIFDGIIKGELIRFLRNTSDEIRFNIKVNTLLKMLMVRGYQKNTLERIRSSIKFPDRHKFIQDRAIDGPTREFFTMPYHPMIKPVWKAIKRGYPLDLAWSHSRGPDSFPEPVKELSEKWPPSIVYKDYRTVHKLGIRAKYSRQITETETVTVTNRAPPPLS